MKKKRRKKNCFEPPHPLHATSYIADIDIFSKGTYLHKLKCEDMESKRPNIRFLQGPLCTPANMSAHPGIANYVLYAGMKCAF